MARLSKRKLKKLLEGQNPDLIDFYSKNPKAFEIVQKVKGFDLGGMSDEELKGTKKEFIERQKRGESLDDLVPELFARTLEVTRRMKERGTEVESGLLKDSEGSNYVWDMVPFEVQLIGALALYEGTVAEMKTGEGKTLVATMPLMAHSLRLEGREQTAVRLVSKVGEVYDGSPFREVEIKNLGEQAGLVFETLSERYDTARMDGNSVIIESKFKPAVDVPRMDIHAHTTFSDGRLSAEELVRLAEENDIGVLGITDHFVTMKLGDPENDTISTKEKMEKYIAEIDEASKKTGIKVLKGIEVDASISNPAVFANGNLDIALPYNKFNELDFIVFEYIQDKDTESEIRKHPKLKDAEKVLMSVDDLIGIRSRFSIPVGIAHSRIAESFTLDDLRKLAENDIFIELNAGYNAYDSQKFLEHLKEFIRLGGKISLGSDTHIPTTYKSGMVESLFRFIKEHNLEDAVIDFGQEKTTPRKGEKVVLDLDEEQGGRGAHLATVNEYLAQRDSEWMKPVYASLGFSVGLNLSDEGLARSVPGLRGLQNMADELQEEIQKKMELKAKIEEGLKQSPLLGKMKDIEQKMIELKKSEDAGIVHPNKDQIIGEYKQVGSMMKQVQAQYQAVVGSINLLAQKVGELNMAIHEGANRAKREAYSNDIMYSTNSELGFDYLRDNLQTDPDKQAQRDLNFCIVDEIDSILIDEARTPLIISGNSPLSEEDKASHVFFDKAIKEMKEEQEAKWKEIKDNTTAGFEAYLAATPEQRLALRKMLKGKGSGEHYPRWKIVKDSIMCDLTNYEDSPVLSSLGSLADKAGIARRLKGVFNSKRLKNKHAWLLSLAKQEFEGGASAELSSKFGIPYRTLEHHEGEALFKVEESEHSVIFTDKGEDKLEGIIKGAGVNLDEVSDEEKVELMASARLALKVNNLFEKNVDYDILDGEIVIIEKETGRHAFGKQYNGGIHQAIQAKEIENGVEITDKSPTVAEIAQQNYFLMYKDLSGMTGTGKEGEEEFRKNMGLNVVQIPTNKKVLRTDHNDEVYRSDEVKYRVMLKDIKKRHERGQPILIGTVSGKKSERLSGMQEALGIPHEVLNAGRTYKAEKKEAEIIAKAGRKGAVTVATNMAGRGTDIKLEEGLNGIILDSFIQEIRGKGNVKVNLPNMETLNALMPKLDSLEGVDDYELMAERQKGGKYSLYLISKESPCLKPSFKEKALSKLSSRWDPVERAVDYETSLGLGLYVLETERNESRRIDNQLKGRGGRQGEFGESKCYVCPDDDLIRVFSNVQTVWKYLLSVEKDEEAPIESRLLNKAIGNAQERVEENNFGARKRMLEFDNVLDVQRRTIYGVRDAALHRSSSLRDYTLGMIENLIRSELKDAKTEEEIQERIAELGQHLPVHWASVCTSAKKEEAIEGLIEQLSGIYEKLSALLPKAMVRGIEGTVLMQNIDSYWQSYLEEASFLKETIYNEGMVARYENYILDQFRKKSRDLFASMVNDLEKDVLRNVFYNLVQNGARKLAAEQGIRPKDVNLEEHLGVGMEEPEEAAEEPSVELQPKTRWQRFMERLELTAFGVASTSYVPICSGEYKVVVRKDDDEAIRDAINEYIVKPNLNRGQKKLFLEKDGTFKEKTGVWLAPVYSTFAPYVQEAMEQSQDDEIEFTCSVKWE